MSAKKAATSTASKKSSKKVTTTKKKKVAERSSEDETLVSSHQEDEAGVEEMLFGGMKPLIDDTKLQEEVQIDLSSKVVLEESFADLESMQNRQQVEEQGSPQNTLTLNLSDSLIRKLKQKAHQEGVKLNEFVTELISEGLVLRAWEIMEKKNTMRGNTAPQNGKFSNNNLKNQNRPNAPFRSNNKNRPHNNSNNNRRNVNYNAIMGEKDNSSFLEYVRNQEKKFNR